MHAPNPRFRFKQMPAEACTHTHTHTHTPTLVYPHNLYSPAFTCTHQNDVEYATQVHTHTHPLLLMLQIHVFGSSKCLQSYIHTEVPNPRLHTKRSRACMLKSPFSVEASARRCTHIHSGTHTRTHPYTRMLLHEPERCRKCIT